MKQSNKLFLAVLLPVALVLACCGAQQTAPKDLAEKKEMASYEAESSYDEYAADKAPAPSARNVSGLTTSGKDDGEIPFVFLSPNRFEKERLLEYQVNLCYETKNFTLSRKEFQDIVSKYGYLSYTTAGYSDLRYSMTAQVNVKVADLYNVIKLLDRLGSLRSENTSVIDHTRDMAWNERKARRLQVRADRIARAVGEVAAANKNWRDREDALERSEDALDNAEQAKWDISDQVTWAKVIICVETPKDPAPVKIPTFRNALVLLLNGFFKVLYVLVVLSPFIVVGALIWWQRKKIAGIFTRKKQS